MFLAGLTMVFVVARSDDLSTEEIDAIAQLVAVDPNLKIIAINALPNYDVNAESPKTPIAIVVLAAADGSVASYLWSKVGDGRRLTAVDIDENGEFQERDLQRELQDRARRAKLEK
jgi:hypothetical protein